MFSRFLKILAICTMLCIFSTDNLYAMNSYVPALEAGYASSTCVYSDSPYNLSIDWIALSDNDSLIDVVSPDSPTSNNWIQSQLSYNTLVLLRANVVYHEDYLVIPADVSSTPKENFAPVCKSFSFDKAKISGKITIPGNQRDTAFLEIEAIGPKLKKSVSSMFASGIMTLRINRPVLLCGHHVESGKRSFLLIELKDGGLSCG